VPLAPLAPPGLPGGGAATISIKGQATTITNKGNNNSHRKNWDVGRMRQGGYGGAHRNSFQNSFTAISPIFSFLLSIFYFFLPSLRPLITCLLLHGRSIQLRGVLRIRQLVSNAETLNAANVVK